jgi:hypothetical protein
MIRSIILAAIFLFARQFEVKAHDTLITAQQAFQIAYDDAKRYVKMSEKWEMLISYDTTRAEWKIVSTKTRNVHRLFHCPQTIVKRRTVCVNSRTRKVVVARKDRIKKPEPPPYF